MEKTKIDRNVHFPMPVVLVGANVDGKANFMAVGWIARANFQPPMLVVGLGKTHHTPQGIREHGTFSVNFPDAGMVEKTDYCGLVSGKNNDKSKVFDIFYGETKTAPMIRECHLCLECRLVNIVDLPTNSLFIGEIIGGYTDMQYLTEGHPDFKKMKSLLLTMPDNSYRLIGDSIAKAWSVGKKLKQ